MVELKGVVVLWFQCQRYNLKAIHNYIRMPLYLSELWFQCQRYNLKAIHNFCQLLPWPLLVVVPMSKIQSESNSQQPGFLLSQWICCGSNVKDTIWKQFTTMFLKRILLFKLWFQCQRYNLKAIHNPYAVWTRPASVVVPMSKIQSESNSQPVLSARLIINCCGSNVKDTIWKQFTT